jgi:hypothetical protein
MSPSQRARRGAHTEDWTLRSRRRALARKIATAAATVDSAFDLERVISGVLGGVWRRRNAPYPGDLPSDWEMALVTLVEEQLRLGGRGSRIALEAIGRLDRGDLGELARMRAAQVGAFALPPWLADVGRAPVVAARSSEVRGEAAAVFLHVGGVPPHTISAFIDLSRGAIAKHLWLSGDVDLDWPGPWADRGPSLRLRPVDLMLACERVRTAIERTDMVARVPVGKDYASVRALVLSRVTPPLARSEAAQPRPPAARRAARSSGA